MEGGLRLLNHGMHYTHGLVYTEGTWSLRSLVNVRVVVISHEFCEAGSFGIVFQCVVGVAWSSIHLQGFSYVVSESHEFYNRRQCGQRRHYLSE